MVELNEMCVKRIEKPVKKVEIDVYASVSNMAKIISGDAAHVHSHFGFHFGFEEFLRPTHGVVQPHLRQGGTLGVGFAATLLRRQRRGRGGAKRKVFAPEDGGVESGWSGVREKHREKGSVALEKRHRTHFCTGPAHPKFTAK